jgi:hypothetical protein
MTPLEETVENYFIELLGLNPDLTGVPINHFESNDVAVEPAAVVQAIQKGHRLDGPRGFDVETTFLYRSTTATPEETSKVSGAIRKSIYDAHPGMTSTESAFGYFLILDEEMNADRTMAKDLKKRLVTVSLIARIEDE